MESVFDDLGQALKAPSRGSARAVVVSLLMAVSVAIGLGIVLHIAAVGRDPHTSDVRRDPQPKVDFYPGIT